MPTCAASPNRSSKAGRAGCHHVEGLSAGRWVLLDFVDFVVHVFHPVLREFYQLERLWGDAPEYRPGA
jgi:ribosome-associated protein